MTHYRGNVRLSFVVATTGRPSLSHMLNSIMEQPLVDGDEIIVVGNPVNNGVPIQYWKFHGPAMIPVSMPVGGDWGHTERNEGMKYATGTHLVFGDDDDAFLPGAVTAIREALDFRPNRPHMFRMIDPNGAILWVDPVVRMGNHGTPQFVAPNDPEKLGQFGHRYEGDFDFVESTLELYPPASLVWDTTILYGCRSFGY